MTIQKLHQLTDWKRTLQIRTVWADCADGQRYRIVEVGRKWVYILCLGDRIRIDPSYVSTVVGL